MPTPLISRRGGPNRCFADFQKLVECATNAKTEDNSICDIYRHDYLECRRHKIEHYKMFIVKQHLQEKLEEGQDLDSKLEEVGAPFVKSRTHLTAKTLGLVDGNDNKVYGHRY